MVAGFLALITGSLLTRPEPPEMLAEFYGRLDSHAELDEKSGEEKIVTKTGHDLLLVHLFDSGISKGWSHFYNRFRVDINGLALAFCVVVVLIALAKAILYLP